MAKPKEQIVLANDKLMERIQALPEIKAESPEDIQARILERIFNTSSLEEMLAPQGTVDMQDLEGQPIIFQDVHFNESGYGNEGDFYSAIDCVVGGQSVVVTSGSRTVMAMVLKAKLEGWMPFSARFVRSPTPTASGFYPWWLEPVAAEVRPNASEPAEPEESF